MISTPLPPRRPRRGISNCGGVALAAMATCSVLVFGSPIGAARMPYEIDLGGISFQSPLTPAEEPRGRDSTSPAVDSGFIVHEREFVSPQARVQMDCQRDKTVIKVHFSKPFNGILGAGKLDTTKCKVMGDGRKYYELQVAHNATGGGGQQNATTTCDTHWDSSRSSISNTLFIRFHSSLETGSDIAKNIMCRLTVGDLIVGRRPGGAAGKPKRKSQPLAAAAAAAAEEVRVVSSGASGEETASLATNADRQPRVGAS